MVDHARSAWEWLDASAVDGSWLGCAGGEFYWTQNVLSLSASVDSAVYESDWVRNGESS